MQHIHIHIHHHGGGENDLPSQSSLINQKLDLIMAKQERFDALLVRMNSVTNNIAEDFKTFVAEYKAGTISDESLAKAEENIATLEALAASKENPIPGEPTDPTTPVEPGTPTDPVPPGTDL